jgi:Zn-dependent peptidase ImmA (M78 family)
LATILGVEERTLALIARTHQRVDSAQFAPAIWYKLRDEKLTSADRELVGVVRKLGYYLRQLQSIRGEGKGIYEPLFSAIRDKVDKSAPPAVQGQKAASEFRAMTDVRHLEQGIGELLRPTLRRLGLLVVETPLKSAVEGCSFIVGAGKDSQICLFANTYRSTWFRRNAVLMHELGHAIFDIDDDQVTIDYRNDEECSDLGELRAQVFARECLVPRSVLIQVQNRFGLKWDSLSVEDVARLVASCEVEKKLVLKSAYDNQLIDQSAFDRYLDYDCGTMVRQFSERALTTKEFLKKQATESPFWLAENRKTTTTARRVRLPSWYVDEVLQTLRAADISFCKAAEMLMIDTATLKSRFGQLLGL